MSLVKLNLASGREVWVQAIGYTVTEGGTNKTSAFKAQQIATSGGGGTTTSYYSFLVFNSTGLDLSVLQYAKLRLSLVEKATQNPSGIVDDIDFGAFTYTSPALYDSQDEVDDQWEDCDYTATVNGTFFSGIETGEQFELDLSDVTTGASHTSLVVQIRWSAEASTVDTETGIIFNVEGLYLSDTEMSTFVTANLAKTLAPATLESEASVLVRATLAKTLVAATVDSTNVITRRANASMTLAPATLESTGLLGAVSRIIVTLGGAFLESEASIELVATLDKTLEAATLEAHGHGPITLAYVGKTLGAATLESEASVEVSAVLSKSLSGATLSSRSSVYTKRIVSLFSIEDLTPYPFTPNLFV